MITLIVPDTHAPFMHSDAIDFLNDLRKEFRPDKIVHLGDEIDACALSKYDHDPDGDSAGVEHQKALVQLKQLYKVFPKVSVCHSNHSSRPFRKAFEAGIPKIFLRAYKDFMEAPVDWQWADRFEIDGVIYQHGEGYSGAQGALRAAERNRKSTVIGHLHSFAGVQFSATQWDQIFGMNCGCLIDQNGYGFAYGKTFPSKPVLGAGIIIDGKQPVFIAFP